VISDFTLQKETQGCNSFLGINSSTATRGDFVAALLRIACTKAASSSTLTFESHPVKVMPCEAEPAKPCKRRPQTPPHPAVADLNQVFGATKPNPTELQGKTSRTATLCPCPTAVPKFKEVQADSLPGGTELAPGVPPKCSIHHPHADHHRLQHTTSSVGLSAGNNITQLFQQGGSDRRKDQSHPRVTSSATA